MEQFFCLLKVSCKLSLSVLDARIRIMGDIWRVDVAGWKRNLSGEYYSKKIPMLEQKLAKLRQFLSFHSPVTPFEFVKAPQSTHLISVTPMSCDRCFAPPLLRVWDSILMIIILFSKGLDKLTKTLSFWNSYSNGPSIKLTALLYSTIYAIYGPWWFAQWNVQQMGRRRV